MKCPKCNSKMKMTDKIETEDNPVYRLYFCTNLECFNSLETIDGKVIGEETKVIFLLPIGVKNNENSKA